MNVIKEHKINNRKKGQVTFGSKHGGTWLFEASDRQNKWQKAMKVPGGLPVAEKIAEVISKSWIRTAGKKVGDSERIDWTARNAIDRLIKLKTLKDWDGETEWWHNVMGDEPSVKMICIHQKPPAGIGPEDIAVEPEAVTAEAEVPALEAQVS